jgi:Protein of unknown function (DUF3168)
MLNSLQVALYAKLSNALPGMVFDQVPQDQEGRYVTVGDDTFTEWDTDDATGFECTATINTYDTNKAGAVTTTGYKGVKGLQETVYNTLHLQPLVVTGYNTVGVVQEYAESRRDNDGISRHGVQRFRILLHK